MVVLDHLRDVGEFAGILFMDLSATAITDHVLVDANLPPRLRHLDVRLTHVTGRRIAELRSQRPGLTILP
jgi:hypothetical protein